MDKKNIRRAFQWTFLKKELNYPPFSKIKRCAAAVGVVVVVVCGGVDVIFVVCSGDGGAAVVNVVVVVFMVSLRRSG
ncbi:Hypothetical predicted protein [Octopus vulgaris]|uniref:Transmembrane protein n=1 Tax=Octopus vulgaris TaxID=6645 RepID=A0AA36BNS2_OCTVU|nr:Hypothetical predicted protein [Octopus vulgaris]